VDPECISQGAGICAGTIAPGYRKRRLVLLVIAPLGSRSCQAGRNYETKGCAASCCIIPDLLHLPRRSLGAGAEAAGPRAGAAMARRRWAGGSERRYSTGACRCHREQGDYELFDCLSISRNA